MYAKCGSIEDAWTVFNKLPTRDVVSWNAMLGGFAMHGHGKEALAHFEHMCVESIKMNGITFVCLLSACSRAGLVDEGLVYFDSMSSIYGISATTEHYACVVDLLGHAGCLHEAEDLIHTMSCTPSASVWKALLGACRIHGNVEMAERVSTQVVEVDPGKAAENVLLSNIYTASGKWELCPNVQ
jgi:pentatricopeptide repeat protein